VLLPIVAKIRDINPNSNEEIKIVAERMRETLIEVLGKDKGESMYSLEWLTERVLWHLDSKNTDGKVIVICNKEQKIFGHAICRIDYDDQKKPFGYFSTIFLAQEFRNLGLASEIVTFVENWFISKNVNKFVYNTATNHTAILKLFHKHGFKKEDSSSEMVQLVKRV
jgi:ribosomal protein S18 acetylase RimI-like enzyme